MARLISKLATNLLLIFLLSTPAFAGIGSITDFRGGGAIKRGTKTTVASKGAGVEKMDTISTNSQGRFRITFNDSTTVNITENSRLLVDDFVYDGGGSSKGKLGLRVALGTVRYASGKVAKTNPRGVNIRTPTATIAVRGTDFVMSVDEAGRSTVVLVPECYNELDITKQTAECPNGSIDVITASGVVTLNQPFQATRVTTRMLAPSKPVVLNLSENAIETLLMSTPEEMKTTKHDQRTQMRGPLDIDFLKEQGLTNALDDSAKQFWQDKLSQNFLDNSFLANLFDIMGNALNEKLLDAPDGMLPDYKKASGIIVSKDDPTVSLCRDNGADRMCITTPMTQNSTLIMSQNNIEFKNRVNQGGNTIITVTQK
jgi:hypothetical protein